MPLSIRFRLLLLVLAVLLPAVALAAWVVIRAYTVERDLTERNLRDTTRVLLMVVDREIAQRAAIARVLSTSRMLESVPPLLGAFDQQARRALQGLRGWVELTSAEVRLIDTRLPQVDEPQPQPLAGGLALADSPRVGALEAPASGGMPHVSVVHPVRRDGKTLFNVVVTMLPSELEPLVAAQQLPEGWMGAVVDPLGAFVASHPVADEPFVRSVAGGLRTVLARGREGSFTLPLTGGGQASGYYSTSPLGWSYVTVMPQPQFAAATTPVLRAAFGALLVLGAAVGGALWVARRIAGPVGALKDAAARIEAGHAVVPQATGIQEFDEVSRALAAAARAAQGAQAALEGKVAEAVAQTRAAEQRVSQNQRAEALGRLTGGVAHDFNNLLGVISNSAHLIQRHADKPEMKMPLAAVMRAVDSGSRMTQHLLRIAGRHPARPALVDLAGYLPEVVELMKVVLGRRIEVSGQVLPGTRCISVDASELELALINLALNARDALPAGGRVWLEARNAAADDTRALPPGDYVEITVNDDGSGIDEAVLDRVFEPFFTTKQTGGGTGLGLAQVHGFCAQAHGRVSVASTRGVGTAVSMVLPAAAAAPAGTPREAAPAGDPRLQGTRLLLVEDNDELANVTAALLASYGCQVVKAGSPAEALTLLETGPFDVVLSDVVMPGDLNGVDLAKRLREARPEQPIVLISGYSNALGSAREFTVLHKPCSPEDLVAALAGEIARHAPPPPEHNV